MKRFVERWRRLLPAAWLGVLGSIALLATPAAFAVLSSADAGRVAGRLLAREATLSLVLGAILLVLERWQARQAAGPGRSHFSIGMALALGTLFCTVTGSFAVQPLMAAARAGQGPFAFGQLHAASVALFAVKCLLVGALAWRAAAAPLRPPSS